MVSTISRAGFLVLGCLSTGNAAAVIRDGNRLAVFVQLDRDLGRVSIHRFVDRVVHDLPDQMMQSCHPDAADVHAGSFADRLKAFEGDDVFGVVGFRGGHGLVFGDLVIR